MSRLRVGTRGSALALAQTRAVVAALREIQPDLGFEEVVITTRGDRLTDRPFAAIGGRGIFAQDIEEHLLNGHVDLAVHSLKDLAATLPAGLTIAAMPLRADPRDALVSSAGFGLDTLPKRARVATSSIRRASLLRHLRPDLQIEGIRGNVPTRLRKMEAERFDGLVLACAGLDRLGLGGAISERLDPSLFLPEAGQGAIAVEVRAADRTLADLAATIHDRQTGAQCTAERACTARLEGTCRTPIAAFAYGPPEKLWLRALVCTPDGRRLLAADRVGSGEPPEALGEAVAADLLARGAGAILGDAGGTAP